MSLLLELSAWPWLERLSRGSGSCVTLANVPAAEWDRIAAGDVDYLFLMGVWTRSAIGREIARTDPGLLREYDRALPGWTMEDVPGSPYSIQAYVPDLRMGGWAGLDAAREALAARGIRLLLDFVPNHTGFDHPWVSAHPRRYVIGSEADARAAPGGFRRVDTVEGPLWVACGRDPYFAPWTDVAQLNYFNPDTRAAMCGVLAEMARHCDGVRCDMAMLLLNEVFDGTWRPVLRERDPRPPDEFWPAATAAVPGLFYLAEVYWDREQTLLEQGFDAAYDKRLVDALQSPDPAASVRRVLTSGVPAASRLARFLENHDEPRSAACLGAKLPAAVAMVLTLPGLRFLFDGQQDGRRIRTPVQLGRWADEPVDEDVRALYDRALQFAAGIEPLRAAHTHADRRGGDVSGGGGNRRSGDEPQPDAGDAWRLLEVRAAGGDSGCDLLAFRWRTPAVLAVVVLNLGDAASQGHVDLGADLPPGERVDVVDTLDAAQYRWAASDLQRSGLYVRLAPGRAHLFMVRAVLPPAS